MKKEDLFDKIEAPADLEAKLETLINRLDEKEKQKKREKRQTLLWIGSAAASIVLFISMSLFFHANKEKNILTTQTITSIEDQEMACLEAQKALELVSRNFNKGMDQLTIVTNEIEKTNNILNNRLKR
jgi:hypothetical protein